MIVLSAAVQLCLAALTQIGSMRLEDLDRRHGLRTNSKHEFEKFCRDCRSDLIWLCHTLVSAWVTKSKPMWSGNPATMSSFESWASIVGGIMETVWPEPDAFLSNRRRKIKGIVGQTVAIEAEGRRVKA